MIFQYLELFIQNRVAYITLNRPQKRNALNDVLVKELIVLFEDLKTNDDAKVMVLKANGNVFSAGADLDYLKQLQANTYDQNLADSTQLMTLFKNIYEHPKLLIAQIEGSAIAGGCGLAAIADLSFAVPEAMFGYTEVKIGFIPALVMVFLIRKIGEGRTKELLLSGNLINAQQAQAYGLINFIEDKNNIADKVRHYAEQICQTASASSLAMTKQMIAQIQNLSYQDGLTHAAEKNAQARASPDCQAGIAAFLNKEKISF